MNKSLKIIICLICSFLAVPACSAFGQSFEELPIGNGRRYLCLVSSSGNTLVDLRQNINNADFNSVLDKFERKLSRIRKRLRRARFVGDAALVSKLKRRRQNVIYVLYDLEDCRDAYGYYEPVGGGGSNPNPAPNPVPPITPPSNGLACQVVGNDSSRSGLFERIINGAVCSVGNSATVALTDRGESYCTGTVVAPRVVITAGHCLEGESSVDITTGLGTVRSASVHVHPNYGRPNDLEINDIAVVITQSDIPSRISDVLLSNDFRVGETSVIGGYGLDENGNAGVLRAATAPIDSFKAGSVTIRYSGQNQNGNTCNGDSGGPIFIERDSQWVLAGVTSNGINADCGPGDVSNFANITDPSNKSFINGLVPGLLQ